MTRPDPSIPSHSGDTPAPSLSSTEIDLDDMTGEIARTLLACEELAAPAIESGAETPDEPSWGGMAGWFK